MSFDKRLKLKNPLFIKMCINKLSIYYGQRGQFLKRLHNFSETHPNHHAYNGILQRGIDTWQECVQSCTGICESVDFDASRGFTCWHHTGSSNCGTLSYKNGCTHYKIRPCSISAAGPPSK